MSLKNRVLKLEKTTNPTGFCICKGKAKLACEIYCQDLSEGGNGEMQLRGDLLPDTCQLCSRPIDKKVFILRLVDDTTNEQFPKEWAE